ncbi:hypothetical protein OEZ85_002191 [Tetradesmus obliquus]|uniref:Uncharacterized protein n=1 Tax=Tetradesmus obliquus TaxID=3088 RepID=A0ABY8U532_TETOB|nr:hypothetical protein OEZ85_002191 [Tetradesmus obliquus]
MQLSLQVTHLGAARASAVLHRTALPHPALLKTTPVALQPRKHVLHTIPHAGSAAAGLPADDPNSSSSSSSSSGAAPGAAGSSSEQKPKRGFWGSVKYFFVGDGLDKERIKALGMGAFASYGFISNLNYGTALGAAWIAFVKKYGVAPTAPGQWKVFLAFYAGLWTLQNFARPLRISLALALAPAFDKAITGLGERLGIDKKWAFGIFLVCMGAVTTVTLFGTIYLLGGFPPS